MLTRINTIQAPLTIITPADLIKPHHPKTDPKYGKSKVNSTHRVKAPLPLPLSFVKTGRKNFNE
jgi:hypothetical protein